MSTLPRTYSKKVKNPGLSEVKSLKLFSRGRIRQKQILDFTRNLTVMLHARVPLLTSLVNLQKQYAGDTFSIMLKGIIRDLEAGKSFSACLSKYDRMFDVTYRQLVAVGEQAGTLPEIMGRIADNLEKREKLGRKFKKALSYPVFVLVISGLVILFLLVVIIPTFADMYEGYGARLPTVTLYMVNASMLLVNYSLFIVVVIIILLWAGYHVSKMPAVVQIKTKAILAVPVFGRFWKKKITADFCQSMATLLINGVRLSDALETVGQSITNQDIKEDIRRMIRSVKTGKSLSASLKKSEFFPQILIQIVSVGEETAELGPMFSTLATAYADELENELEVVMSIVEPALIVFIGIIIGAVVVAMYLPIFELVNVIH